MASSNNSHHSYVIYFDGQLDIDSDELLKRYDSIFNDLDEKRTINEKAILYTEDSHFYTLEAFIEARSDNDVEYIDNYVKSHPYINIADVKIPIRQARKIISLTTIKGSNADGREYGSFTKLTSFKNIGSYNESSMGTLEKLSYGSMDVIQNTISANLSKLEAYNFNRWLDTLETSQNINLKISWHSNSFFEMEDGSYIDRAMFFYVVRELGSDTNALKKGSALKDGFENR